VVAGCQDVDAGVVELAAQAFGQAKSAGCIFRVDDDQVDREFLPQCRYMLLYGVPPRASHNIAAKQNDHGAPSPDPSERKLRGEAASAVGVQTLRGPP